MNSLDLIRFELIFSLATQINDARVAQLVEAVDSKSIHVSVRIRPRVPMQF